jgi:hypothetical protein
MDLAEAQTFMNTLHWPEGRKVCAFLRENPGEGIPEGKVQDCENYLAQIEKDLLPRAQRRYEEAKSETERRISAQRPKHHAKLWSKWERQHGADLRNAVTALEEEAKILKAAVEKARKQEADAEEAQLKKAFSKLSKADRREAEAMLRQKPHLRPFLIRHPERGPVELKAWREDQRALSA